MCLVRNTNCTSGSSASHPPLKYNCWTKEYFDQHGPVYRSPYKNYRPKNWRDQVVEANTAASPSAPSLLWIPELINHREFIAEIFTLAWHNFVRCSHLGFTSNCNLWFSLLAVFVGGKLLRLSFLVHYWCLNDVTVNVPQCMHLTCKAVISKSRYLQNRDYIPRFQLLKGDSISVFRGAFWTKE